MSSQNIKNLVKGAIDATQEITSGDAKKIIKEFLKVFILTYIKGAEANLYTFRE